MINFKSDYLEETCSEIIERLAVANFEQISGYSEKMSLIIEKF